MKAGERDGRGRGTDRVRVLLPDRPSGRVRIVAALREPQRIAVLCRTSRGEPAVRTPLPKVDTRGPARYGRNVHAVAHEMG